MIRAALWTFLSLTLMLACACSVFGPNERADVVRLAKSQRETLEIDYRDGYVSDGEYREVADRLDRILAAARDESTRDVLLDIGLGLGGVLLGAKGKAAARVIGSAVKRHRGAPMPPKKGKP